MNGHIVFNDIILYVIGIIFYIIAYYEIFTISRYLKEIQINKELRIVDVFMTYALKADIVPAEVASVLSSLLGRKITINQMFRKIQNIGEEDLELAFKKFISTQRSLADFVKKGIDDVFSYILFLNVLLPQTIILLSVIFGTSQRSILGLGGASLLSVLLVKSTIKRYARVLR